MKALVLGAVLAGAPVEEARVTLDVKDAQITGVVSALAEVAGFQVVFDPDISCALTLKLHEVRWRAALDASLRACRLAFEEDGDVLRIAPSGRLSEEAQAARRLQEERDRSRPASVAAFRLSYARAAEMAPLIKRFLSPRGDVVFDARTNTLIVID